MHSIDKARPYRFQLSLYWIISLYIMTCVFSLEANPLDKVPIISYEYPPYTSDSLEGGGMRTKIATAAYKALNVDTSVNLLPTIRAQTQFITSPSLVYMGILTHFSKHDQKTLIFVPLMPIRLAIFYYSPAYPSVIDFQRTEDLQPYSVGTMLGSVTAKHLRKAHVEVQEQSNLEGLLKKLHARRIDFAAMTDLFGIQTSAKLFPNESHNFKQLPKPLMEAWIGLMFHKSDAKAQTRARKFKQGMKQIIEDGTYLKIISSYYHQETVPKNILDFINETSLTSR